MELATTAVGAGIWARGSRGTQRSSEVWIPVKLAFSNHTTSTPQHSEADTKNMAKSKAAMRRTVTCCSSACTHSEGVEQLQSSHPLRVAGSHQ